MKNVLMMTLAAIVMAGNLPLLAAEDEKEILYWVAPMDPNYRRDEPGKSPMGMELIPVYAGAEDEGSDVTISPAVVQNLGVRTEAAQMGTLSRLIDTVGYIDYDESKVSHIHLRVSGWIEKLSVKSAGEQVRKNQRLFNLYSPDLVNVQEEFIRALNSGNKGLIEASRDRLSALGISRGEIVQLEKRRKVKQTVAIYAPQDGVVSELPVREGMYVKPAMNVMTLADLSSVWLIAEIFERQANWVRTGDKAIVTLPFLPGKTWQGKVEYIYPSLDKKTRTLMARLRFDNPGEALKPNMYARVKLYASPRDNVVSIPLEALIRTGDRERVIVQVGDGQFDAREVRTGIESGDRIEIIEGLKADEKVVISGQFLLDSEASLKASFTRMGEGDEKPQDSTNTSKVTATGSGVVVSLDAAEMQIRLKHGPIPELGWDAMEMLFPLGTGVDGLKPGDRVEFDLEKQGNGYVVIAVRPADQEQQP
ncbi:MAG TPA: efflux RND transporter periplasmic adaptor subunit [Thiolapillus brandeum]|uniref:Efflux RND transporter periplasmic adaptor subunit n=1 Tax=Thiolapillus brandeum TaxID=1076588 RepID=A0A831RXR2_9GAMM|nr:efflux RND transporter periplasmic adaptor subunit [Thiolapillus brandeum]